MQSYQLARGRAAASSSRFMRLVAERDEALWNAALLERELGVYRRRIEAVYSHKRPPVAPGDRFEILQIMRLRAWTLRHAAKRFGVHHNSIWEWSRRFRRGADADTFFGAPPLNRTGDALRWLVHEFRRTCPQLALGTRTIAGMIIQAGLQISRSTVQRMLREKPPKRPARAALNPDGRRSYGLLKPKCHNRTWHLDLTMIRTLLRRYYVAAIVDGFSRRILALKICANTPNTAAMLGMFRDAIAAHGRPRFLVTDHGCQFRERFTSAVENGTDIRHVKAKVRSWALNGKVERLFRTFKLWSRCVLWAWAPRRSTMAGKIQLRLDVFREWYNVHRPSQALGGRTPDQAWRGEDPPPARVVRARDAQPGIRIVRHRYGDDPRLPMLEIEIDWPEAA